MNILSTFLKYGKPLIGIGTSYLFAEPIRKKIARTKIVGYERM